MNRRPAEWDPTTFSPMSYAENLVGHCLNECSQPRCPYKARCANTRRKSRQVCYCGDTLAPHMFVVCLEVALSHAKHLLEASAFQVDVDDFLWNMLDHVWEAHVPVDGSPLDESRRMEAVTLYYKKVHLPSELDRILSEFMEAQVEAKIRTEKETIEKTQTYPCGTPSGSGKIHVRLNKAATEETWREALEDLDSDQVCGRCEDIALFEIDFAGQLAS